MELRICPTCTAVRPGATACPGCQGPLRLADAQLFVGEDFGNYHVDAVLGQGGMGVVYHATHRTLRRPAALKVVVPHSADTGFERRFLREACVLAELRHPQIVEIYDFDVNRWGLPYYVMEHLGGAPLRLLVDLSRAGLAPAVVGALLADLAAGLTFAHRKGVVHRDLKPDNVFVARFDGRAEAKLLDFGIAKLLADDDEPAGTLTATGALLGTPHYVAPEQASGEPVSPATDQYALALMVAEMLIGRPVRAGKTLMQILADDVRRPLDPGQFEGFTSAAIGRALQRATQPDPAARFPDVASFVAALELTAPDRAGLLALLPQPAARAGHGASAPLDATRDDAVPATTQAQTGAVAVATEFAAGSATTPPPTVAAAPAAPGATPTPAPVAGARRQHLRLALVAGALLGLGLVAVAWLRWPRPAPPTPPAARQNAAPTLSLRQVWTVPPDVTRLLLHRDNTLVMAGGGALYLQSTRASQTGAAGSPAPGPSAPPLRIALGTGQEVLGPSRDGDIFVLDGARVLRFDPLQQKSVLWIERLRRAPDEAGHRDIGRVLVSPSGLYVAQIEAGRIRVCARPAALPTCVPAFEAAWDVSAGLHVALSERYLAVAQEQRSLDIYRTAGGTRVRHTPLSEARVHDVALLDEAGLVALGGWYPRIDVFTLEDGTAATALPRQGPAVRLAWLGDAPTLLVGGPAGLQLWRPGGALEDVPAPGLRGLTLEGQGLGDLLVGADVVAALNGDDHAVALYDYDSLRGTRRMLASDGGALWALAADPDGSHVYAGSSRGPLLAYDVQREHLDTLRLHADGITDIAMHAGTLASSSDDATVAVWRLPGLEVLWRQRAHDFLVNQLVLAGQPPTLWTASSDGSVKRWGWPQPEQQELLDTRRLVGGTDWALHALWVAPAGDLILAGTWEHALLELRRDARGRWSGRRLPVESTTLYRAIDVPAVEAVVFVGLSPHLVWIYDRRDGQLSRLPSLGHLVNSGCAGAQAGEVYVAGQAAVLRYRLRRAADGGLDGDFSAALDTRLGVALSATWLPRPGGAGRLVLGGENGQLTFVDPRALERHEALPLRQPTRPAQRASERQPPAGHARVMRTELP
jgi:serine/threonine-protein kinase